MIPTLLLFGALCGRWWRAALVVAAVGWPLRLVVGGVPSAGPGLPGGSGLAVVNTAGRVPAHQGVLRMVRAARS
ncbi:hypothetical protein O7606_02765 [Micromonospora sp. WMMD882]|uniref:hypothetical protein n=1 Tax=Micromonospora sp. WMMD882 TaxID=3015151 RepID=UPI00248B9589|nr:hypothetical protein [Micromonospora sp. WMMD882]WBB80318.1 hypothetical protein O7606_02765 [Micromonospora sp. WMMD882]